MRFRQAFLYLPWSVLETLRMSHFLENFMNIFYFHSKWKRNLFFQVWFMILFVSCILPQTASSFSFPLYNCNNCNNFQFFFHYYSTLSVSSFQILLSLSRTNVGLGCACQGGWWPFHPPAALLAFLYPSTYDPDRLAEFGWDLHGNQRLVLFLEHKAKWSTNLHEFHTHVTFSVYCHI